ncbi:MAG: glycosyltransferase family 2 protein [Pseudomonadota bacterium]
MCKGGIPESLLILNRFGIDHATINSVWIVSNLFEIPPEKVLIKSGLVSEAIWRRAQRLLDQERQKLRHNLRTTTGKLENAIYGLFRNKPHYSAYHTLTGWQCVAILIALFFSGLAYFTVPGILFSIIVCVFSLFYLLSILMRALIIAGYSTHKTNNSALLHIRDEDLPVYTILVALYKEQEQIKQLAHHLSKLNWPKNKLDIKLVCEADDIDTIVEIKRLNLPGYFETVLVPPADPRTKPKALNFALPTARGEYLVLYDAEDIPSPNQLREAFAHFKSNDLKLACLQAPLHIHNRKQNWLSRMFWIEYMTLFNGVLPVLARWNIPIPLGGTSNHFRTNVLQKIGGWDPFNVTEDADLGIRLYREGYRCGTISLPTFEEAPPDLWPWITQRTRWIKGWMQTILVHMRHPGSLKKEIGWRNLIAFHLILTSVVISTLFHPLFLGFWIMQMMALPLETPDQLNATFLFIGAFNLVGGYTTYAMLSYAVLRTEKQSSSLIYLLSLPAYWLLISWAAWRALAHLITKPHKWEKTPHGLVKTEFRLRCDT